MVKYFQISKEIIPLSKDDIKEIETGRERSFSELDNERQQRQQAGIAKNCNLRHVDGRVIVVVNTQMKNYHSFSDGTTIRLERGYNNFNRRQTQPVNAFVVSGEGISGGSEVLISHNALHETNLITDYSQLGKEVSEDIKYYSLPVDDCFAWRKPKEEWMPLSNFEFGLRLFAPYGGSLQGIDPTRIKDVLYVTTGKLKGSVCNVLKASDYEIIFQGDDGQEKSIIRFRHSEEEDFIREEVLCINHELTEQVNNNELLIGYNIKDAKWLKQ